MLKLIDRLIAAQRRSAAAIALDEPALPSWLVWLLGCAAYGLGVWARLDVKERSLPRIALGPDGSPILTTMDAYYYATGIEQALSGLLSGYDRVPTVFNSALVALGAAIARSTGASTSELAYLMPTAVAPLLALVVVVWGFALGLPRVAALAAFPAAIGYSYLNRTSPGQLDTDMLSISWPYLTLACTALGLARTDARFSLVAGLLAALSQYVHPGSERVLLGSSLALVFYVSLFQRDRLGVYACIALLSGLLPVSLPVRVGMLLATFAAQRAPRVSLRLLSALAVVVGAFSLQRLLGSDYASLLGLRSSEPTPGYGFYDVRSEVAELRGIKANVMIGRVAGQAWMLWLGALGGALLLWTRPLAVLLLPMALLGTYGALEGGLRFTIYAPAALALGGSYFLCALTDLARASLPRLRGVLVGPGALGALAILLTPAVPYVRTVLKGPTVTVNDAALAGELAQHIKPGDYVLGLWDLGYPLWYYAHGRTLVDGMKQDADLFVIAEVLFGDSQLRSAHLARLAVETQRASGDSLRAAMPQLLQAASAEEGNGATWLTQLEQPGFPLPKPAGNIYLFAPFRTADLATLTARGRKISGLSSREHLDTGYLGHGSAPYGVVGNIGLQPGGLLDTRRWQVRQGGKVSPVATVITVRPAANGHVQVTGEVRSPNGKFHVIYLPAQRKVVVVDAIMLRSTYVQLALFHAPDARAFEPVIMGREGVVYRVLP